MKTVVRLLNTCSDPADLRLNQLFELKEAMETAFYNHDWQALLRLDRLCGQVLKDADNGPQSKEVLEAMITVKALYTKMIASLGKELSVIARQVR